MLTFESSPENAASRIAVVDGFSGAVVGLHKKTFQETCITFRNTDSKTAVLIGFVFFTFGKSGELIESQPFNRAGHFMSGIVIEGPPHPDQPPGPIKGRNCIFRQVPKAVLTAAKMLVRVDFVNFDDGSRWDRDGSQR